MINEYKELMFRFLKSVSPSSLDCENFLVPNIIVPLVGVKFSQEG